MKYIIIITICLLPLICCGISEKKQEQHINKKNGDQISDVYVNTTASLNTIPSVEDTVLHQIGVKLFFVNDTAPTDSITVINTNHYYSPDYGQYLEYEFIVHNKRTPFHERFTSKQLDKQYKAYFVEDPDMHEWYTEDYQKYYNESINDQKKAADNIDIDKSINSYIGYWIYLRNYNNQFYINDAWAWLGSFYISDNVLTRHYMDGPYPYVIEIFKEDKNGDLLIKTVDDTSTIRYELVDKELKIYKLDNYYIVPAKNVNCFEIIEYANNTGDLI